MSGQTEARLASCCKNQFHKKLRARTWIPSGCLGVICERVEVKGKGVVQGRDRASTADMGQSALVLNNQIIYIWSVYWIKQQETVLLLREGR